MSDLRAVLEGIVYGGDPKILPADRLRAAGQLQALEDNGRDALMRELLALNPDAVQAEYDAYVAQYELPALLDDDAAAAKWPLCAAALQRAVQERAEARARELADAARIERTIREHRCGDDGRQRRRRAPPAAWPCAAGADREGRAAAVAAAAAAHAQPVQVGSVGGMSVV
jgi:hypothetical protein